PSRPPRRRARSGGGDPRRVAVTKLRLKPPSNAERSVRESSLLGRSRLTGPSSPCSNVSALPCRLAVHIRHRLGDAGFFQLFAEGGLRGANWWIVAIAQLASDCRAGRSGLRRRGRSRRRADSV